MRGANLRGVGALGDLKEEAFEIKSKHTRGNKSYFSVNKAQPKKSIVASPQVRKVNVTLKLEEFSKQDSIIETWHSAPKLINPTINKNDKYMQNP